MQEIKHKDLIIEVADTGKFSVLLKGADLKKVDNQNANFEINVNGGEQLMLNENNFVFKGIDSSENTAVLAYECKRYPLEVEVKLDFIPNANVFTQTNTVKNTGDTPILLTKFSSSHIDGIANDEKAWYKHNLRMHICHSKWQGEGQWKTYTPAEIGLYPTTTHCWERETFKVNSIGSWSTAFYYPLVMIEDIDENRIWFMEIEGSHNWYLKFCSYGGYNDSNLTLEASGCDETFGGWHYELLPNETYTAERAIVGLAEGGFEEAVRELTIFKRQDSLIKYENDVIPIVFNDYMDCVWGNQHPDAVIPLIEKSAELGCEVFCIDGGWCANASGVKGLGDWHPRNELYGEVSLKELADKIKEAGMIPGIWLELDACEDTAYGFTMDEDSVIKRYNTPVGSGGRHFYNFCNEKVREYLTGRIAELYDMGFRYIKNDYNQSTGIGCTNNYEGDSPAEGLIQNNDAFLAFADELYVKFPGLVIENCSSGGLREDNKMLRHFALQSTSDQELYENNVSILMGSMAIMAPEKAGIWSYPYPAMLDEHKDFKVTDEYAAKMADGKQTVFNMATAMLGVLYQSGRVECCDEKNFALIKEGIDLYKKIRGYIPVSMPIYPLGMHNINEKEVTALGLLSEEKLIMTVWNLKDTTENVTVDLSKYIDNDARISNVYAASEKCCTLENRKFNVRLEGMEAVNICMDLK